MRRENRVYVIFLKTKHFKVYVASYELFNKCGNCERFAVSENFLRPSKAKIVKFSIFGYVPAKNACTKCNFLNHGFFELAPIIYFDDKKLHGSTMYLWWIRSGFAEEFRVHGGLWQTPQQIHLNPRRKSICRIGQKSATRPHGSIRFCHGSIAN